MVTEGGPPSRCYREYGTPIASLDPGPGSGPVLPGLAPPRRLPRAFPARRPAPVRVAFSPPRWSALPGKGLRRCWVGSGRVPSRPGASGRAGCGAHTAVAHLLAALRLLQGCQHPCRMRTGGRFVRMPACADVGAVARGRRGDCFPESVCRDHSFSL